MPFPSPPVVRLAALAAALCLVTGCAATGPDPAPGTATFPLAERHTWGGMCASGPCSTTLTISSDGAWVLERETGSSEGRLGSPALDQVRSAVRRTTLDEAPRDAALCEADRDGTSLRYGWAGPDGWLTRSSCEVRLGTDDPLVTVLDRLAADLDG